MFEHHGDEPLSANGGVKKATVIFTGTLGALRARRAMARLPWEGWERIRAMPVPYSRVLVVSGMILGW